MSIKWKQDSVKAMREERAAAARAEALVTQAQVAARAFAAASTDIQDAQALEMPDMFPAWQEVLDAGKELPKGRIITKDAVLYRVMAPVTPQSHQEPGGEGMLAVYRPIDQTHAGTQEDPIPYVYGMDCLAGVYYSYHGHTYRVADGGTMAPCIWPPDTAGMWQWELIE